MLSSSPGFLQRKLIESKEKLINLTRQNNLLFYKKRKNSSLVIKQPSLQLLFNGLVNEDTFKFWMLPKQANQQALQNNLFDAQKDPVDTEVLESNPPEDDEIVCNFSTNEELLKILKSIYRRAKTETEERGLNICYAFFGLLEWKEKETSENCYAPLVLVPVILEHKSANKPYELTVGDDEILINPAIRVKLKRDFNLVLPEPEDLESINLEDYFKSVEKKFKEVGFKVKRETHIGLFSFYKLIMYNDYEKHLDLYKKHSLIGVLGGEGDIRDVNGSDLPKPEDLDAISDPKRMFHVLDADSSQHVCIQAAVNGNNFVMIGPPGTGKSQTIANIIAKFLEDNKSVLFISEKMAALDVVYKRLNDVGLSDFCLELHSHKANKKKIITELGRSLTERTIPKKTISTHEHQQLLTTRDTLNLYIRELHQVREPFGYSVFDVLGKLAALDSISFYPCSFSNIEEMTPALFNALKDLIRRTKSVWEVLEIGSEHPWYGFKKKDSSPKLQFEMEEFLKKLEQELRDCEKYYSEVSEKIGLEQPANLTDCEEIFSLGELLEKDYFVDESWIGSDLDKLLKVNSELRARASSYLSLKKEISSKYKQDIFDLPTGLETNLDNLFRKLSPFFDMPLSEGLQICFNNRGLIKENLSQYLSIVNEITRDAVLLFESIELKLAMNIRNIEWIAKAISPLTNPERPNPIWFENKQLDDTKKLLLYFEELVKNCIKLKSEISRIYKEVIKIKATELDVLTAKQKKIKYKILSIYKEEIISTDLNSFNVLYAENGLYGTSFIKYFLPQYYKDKQYFRSMLKNKITLRDSDIRSLLKNIEEEKLLELQVTDRAVDCKKITEDHAAFNTDGYNFDQSILNLEESQKGVRKIEVIDSQIRFLKELRSLEFYVTEHHEEYKKSFGYYYTIFSTDFDKLNRAVNNLEEAKKYFIKSDISNSQITSIVQSISKNDNVKELNDRIRESLNKLFSVRKKSIINFILDANEKSETKISLEVISRQTTELIKAFSELDYYSEKMISLKDNASYEISNYQQLIDDLKLVNKIKLVEEKERAELASNKALFKDFYQGVVTDFKIIESSLVWLSDVQKINRPSDMSDNFKKVISNKNNRFVGDLDKSIINKTNSLIAQYQEYFENFKDLDSRAVSFASLKIRAQVLLQNSQGLRSWIDLQKIKGELRLSSLETFVTRLAISKIDKEQLIVIFEKSVYQEWNNYWYTQKSILNDFRGIDHDNCRRRFKELDEKLSVLSRASVIESANKKKPIGGETLTGGSQVGILRKEMAKQKKHMPLKKLFEKIPDLIGSLKHCFLMSPMSVCQFIEPGIYNFDLVVFDEASQICTEDALPAIIRGKQVVITGDNKQLPPTSFFKVSELSEYDSEEEAGDYLYANMDSILDECESSGMNVLRLDWHYRSRHEDLIAYSNSQFYSNKLITFPCPEVKNDALGVKFVYVKDGAYDRGGKRNNIKEAEVVADLVIDHLRRCPEKTLGVVALSISQRDAIDDALEIKLKNHPDLSEFFSSDRSEYVFRKNLENVQGDERDVIIFSIGYGKDSAGKLTMNFGPINKNEGQRRLNVVITRAREKNIVVSSIRASDFDLSAVNTAGVMHLQKYLDYAENGHNILNVGQSTLEDFDSPFEESVAAEIRILGYDVKSQVGCSGYKIDLCVVDPANPSRFILGIECDGATYHSSYTARDRDRIRQAALENLGWRIYRIWSPDWVSNKQDQIERLRNAIEKARYSKESKKESKSTLNVEIVSIVDMDVDPDEEIKEYSVCELRVVSKHPADFYAAGSETHIRRAIEKLVNHEAPIHLEMFYERIVSIFNVSRVGSRIVKRLNQILRTLMHDAGLIDIANGFVYLRDREKVVARCPSPNNPSTFRPIEYIATEEIQSVMLCVIRKNVGANQQALFSQTLKIFGIQRSSENIEKVLSGSLNKLKNSNLITQRDDYFLIKRG